MMRVLLISPNVEFLPDPILPLGLAYIAAALKRRGIDHRVLDLCFVTDVEDALSAEIASYRPDLTGLSLRNLDNVSYPQYTSYLPFYREVIDIIRRHSDSRIVLGGSAFSLGCPFNCIYCTYPIIEGRRVRLRSPKRICDEIESLVEFGINNLFVVDNEFNFPVEHAQFVCHEIINRKLQRKIRRLGARGPLWEYMKMGQRFKQ